MFTRIKTFRKSSAMAPKPNHAAVISRADARHNKRATQHHVNYLTAAAAANESINIRIN
jgi:hypothetical protein